MHVEPPWFLSLRPCLMLMHVPVLCIFTTSHLLNIPYMGLPIAAPGNVCTEKQHRKCLRRKNATLLSAVPVLVRIFASKKEDGEENYLYCTQQIISSILA